MPFFVRSLLILAAVPTFGSSALAQRGCQDSTSVPGSTSAWNAPLDRVVSAHFHELALRDALARLAAAARVRLSYSPDLIPLDRSVCLRANDVAIGDALTHLLVDVPVRLQAVATDHVALVPTSPPTPQASAMALLDRVVITGSVIGSPSRELPVSLALLDGEHLRDENPSRNVSQMINGAVPGVWLWESTAAPVARYASIRGASSFGATYPKVYVDGIEIANPLLVTYLMPEMIDRIEAIRGPQGSALYGTDAISGVVHIVTRNEAAGNGAGGSLRSQAGGTTSDYGASTALLQQHAATVRGGNLTRSVGAGLTVAQSGAYLPNTASRAATVTVGTRLVGASAILTGTARLFAHQAGFAVSPLLADTTAIAADSLSSRQSVRHWTIGANVRAVAGDRVTHTLTIGADGYRLAGVEHDALPVPRAVDPVPRTAAGFGSRASARLSTVVRVPLANKHELSTTVGAEYSRLREGGWEPPLLAAQPGAAAPRPGYQTGASTWSSAGLLAQATAGFWNTAYLTGGLRLEHHGGFVSRQSSLLPSIGISLVRNSGPVFAKLRGAYGRGIRPQKSIPRESAWVGARVSQHPTNLAPEEQSGIEFGADVGVSGWATLEITRFDQLASGLVQRVTLGADTTRRARAGPRAVGYLLQNVGAIANRGWELAGRGARGPFMIDGSFTLVDSRVRRIAAGYRGDLRVGDRMLEVPARTYGLTARWNAHTWQASLGATRVADWVNYDRLGLAWAITNGFHPGPEDMGRWLRGFWEDYPGNTRVRAAVIREIRRGLSLSFYGDNLLDQQTGEPDNTTVIPGRAFSVSIRYAF